MKKLMQMMLVAVMAVTIVGCQTATQPGRSQTQTFDGCTFNVLAAPGTGVVTAASDGKKPGKFAIGDVFAQNMMVETGGNEANSSEATSVPSTSVPLNVAWGAGAIGGGGSGTGTGMSLDTAYLAFKKWWSEGGTKATTPATTATPATSTPATSNPAAGATCTTGSCEWPAPK